MQSAVRVARSAAILASAGLHDAAAVVVSRQRVIRPFTALARCTLPEATQLTTASCSRAATSASNLLHAVRGTSFATATMASPLDAFTPGVAPGDGAATPDAADRSVFVKIGDGAKYVHWPVRWGDVKNMSNGKLLVTLAESPLFKGALKNIALGCCTIVVVKSDALGGADVPLTDHEYGSNVVELRCLGTLESAAKEATSSVAPLFVRVHLPAPMVLSGSAALDVVRRQAHATQVRLVSAMWAAEVKDIEHGCQLIVLPNDADGQPVYWPGRLSNTLLVRPSFKPFFETQLKCCNLKPGRDAHYRTLLRGERGIGTSALGHYVLWRLVRDGRHTVIYDYPDGLGDGTPMIIGSDVTMSVCICDGCESKMGDIMTLMISTDRDLVLGTPGPRPVHHSFEERAKSVQLSAPSEDEIVLMAEHCVPSWLKPPGGAAGVRARIQKWGLVPLRVFSRAWNHE